jgi:hypothetical protein
MDSKREMNQSGLSFTILHCQPNAACERMPGHIMEAPAPRSEVGNWCNGLGVGLKFRVKGLGGRVKGIGSWV